MNNPMFYYPPYPYEDMMEVYNDEVRSESSLFTPELALIHGNAFKNEYLPYKNYKVKRIVATNEKESLFLTMIAYFNICHDIQLRLDINPDNIELLNELKKYQKAYYDARKKYDAYDDQLCPYHIGEGDRKYRYVYTKSPWENGGQQ